MSNYLYLACPVCGAAYSAEEGTHNVDPEKILRCEAVGCGAELALRWTHQVVETIHTTVTLDLLRRERAKKHH